MSFFLFVLSVATPHPCQTNRLNYIYTPGEPEIIVDGRYTEYPQRTTDLYTSWE